jgi:hypothetical protein
MTDILDQDALLAIRQAFAFVWVIVFAGAFVAFANRLSSIKLQEKFPSKGFVAFPGRRQCHAAMTFCGETTLPFDFDIFSPRSSRTKPCVSTMS